MSPSPRGYAAARQVILKLFQFPRVVIRGELQDDAVLCTEKETFDLKLADTSNTMLLTPNTLLPEMPGIVNVKYYPIRECDVC